MDKLMLESYHCNLYEDKQGLEDCGSLEKLMNMFMRVKEFTYCV